MRIPTFAASSLLASGLLLAACSKPPSSPPETTANPATEETPDATPEEGSPEGGGVERPGITAAACEEQGGTVVGDIGDGAIHKPEYRCPDSGEAPVGNILAETDGPVAVEGSVCCK
jgi:hypothetical protein